MNETVQQHSDIIEQLQSKIQTLTDENRLLKQRMDEVGISYAPYRIQETGDAALL